MNHNESVRRHAQTVSFSLDWGENLAENNFIPDEFVTLSLTLNVSSMTLFTEMSISYEPKREAAEMILHNVQFQCVLKVARKTDQQSSVEKCEVRSRPWGLGYHLLCCR